MRPSLTYFWFLVVITLGVSGKANAQSLFDSFETFKDTLTTLSGIQEASERETRLAALWDTLRANDQIPYAQGDRVAFLYKGTASSISFPGDHNRWNIVESPATRIGESDVWMHEVILPDDARVDYKIVLNGSEWILDPENPKTQVGGFGPNSELRMPAYEPSPWVERRDGVEQGTYSRNLALASSMLGYTVTYRVYTPAGYNANQLSNLPVIYVTDGHEYADDLMGSMRIVLDNLIAEQAIEPIIAVFIDPRVNGENIRSQQYRENPAFAGFVADELVPAIDSAYRTNPDRMARGILGTSFGGLNSAYFGAQETETFYNIGIQSPAFHGGPTIYSLYNDEPVRNIRIHMTWGTINDGATGTGAIVAILAEKGYEFTTLVMNEGHSWGFWRALLDDVLIYFWGTNSSVSTEKEAVPNKRLLGSNYPNPFSQTTSIPYSLSTPGHVKLTIYDMLGRSVAVLVDDRKGEGAHSIQWDATKLPSGQYYARLVIDGKQSEIRMMHLRK